MARHGKHQPLGQPDALSLLKADHDKVLKLFHDLDFLQATLLQDDGRKADLVERICHELTVHAALEEQAFYPAIRAAADVPGMLEDAQVEHEAARLLIAELKSMYPDDEHFGATVAVLGEETRHHIEEEEGALFACARSCGLDLQLLGSEMLLQRRRLNSEARLGGAPLNGTRFESFVDLGWGPHAAS